MKRRLIAIICILALLLSMTGCMEKQTAGDSAPEIEEEKLQKYDFVIDYQRIPELAGTYYGERTIETAKLVIDTFLSGGTEVAVSDMGRAEMEDVQRLIRILCPPFLALAKVNIPDSFTKTYSTFSWTYRYEKDKEEQLLSDFEDEIKRYMDLLYENDSDTVRALILFLEFSKNTTYDNQLAEDEYGGLDGDELAMCSTAFGAIMNHTAVCYTYAETLCFLLNQAGIDSVPVTENDEHISHEWTLSKIDGNYYHMDATWSSDYSYYNTVYFGMSTNDRISGDNRFDEKNFWCNYQSLSGVVEVNDTRFDKLHASNYSLIKKYEVNHRDQLISFTFENGETVEYIPM